jgi:hypothetical protein
LYRHEAIIAVTNFAANAGARDSQKAVLLKEHLQNRCAIFQVCLYGLMRPGFLLREARNAPGGSRW